MSSNIPLRTPSATELIAILSSRETTRIGKPAPIIALIPRPRWWLRVLMLVSVTILGLFAVFSVIMALLLSDIAHMTMVQRQLAVPNVHAALPSAEQLRDPQAFATAVQRQPDEIGHLHLARAHLLLDAGRHQEAVNDFAAAADSTTGLPAAQRLCWAEVLERLGRYAEAATVISGIDTAVLEPELRARTAALTGRCVLALRQPTAP